MLTGHLVTQDRDLLDQREACLHLLMVQVSGGLGLLNLQDDEMMELFIFIYHQILFNRVLSLKSSGEDKF